MRETKTFSPRASHNCHKFPFPRRTSISTKNILFTRPAKLQCVHRFPDKDVCSYALDFETQPLFLFINGSFFLSSSALHPKKEKEKKDREEERGGGSRSSQHKAIISVNCRRPSPINKATPLDRSRDCWKVARRSLLETAQKDGHSSLLESLSSIPSWMAIFLSFSHLAPFRQPAPFLPTRKSYKHRPTQRQDGEELFRLQQTLTRCQPSLYRTPPLLFLPFYQSYLHTFYKRSILGAKQSASRTSLFAARRRTEGEKKKKKPKEQRRGWETNGSLSDDLRHLRFTTHGCRIQPY